MRCSRMCSECEKRECGPHDVQLRQNNAKAFIRKVPARGPPSECPACTGAVGAYDSALYGRGPSGSVQFRTPTPKAWAGGGGPEGGGLGFGGSFESPVFI